MSSDTPRRRSGLVVERAGREILVYSAGAPGDQGASAVAVLNSTAALIWDLADGDHTLADIEQALRRAFAVPPQRDLSADVRETVLRLRNQGLLAE